MSDLTRGEGFFSSAEGIKLFYRRWETLKPRVTCLLVHGLAEHTGRYEAFAHELATRNYSVWAMDNRGHGRSGGAPCDCRSITGFVEDLRRFLHETQGSDSPLPRILIGHSLGGLIALSYAASYPNDLRGVAVSSPALRLTHPPSALKVAFVSGLARLSPTTPVPNGVNPHHLCRDSKVVQAYIRDPLIHRTLTAQCAVTLKEAMAQANHLAPQLKIPCLILQAGNDQICDPNAAAEFAGSVRSDLVSFRLYEGYSHELFNEPEKERVVEDLCHWIERVTS